MRAAVFKRPFELHLENLDLPGLKPDELRIAVEACGICGTDALIYAGKAPASPPVILGHEYTGKIVEVGPQVWDLKVGDRVVVDPNIHCTHCSFCRNGSVHLCLNLKALGVNMNGGFAEFSIIPASQAYILPSDFPAKAAAFAEPLSCCLHGIQRASIAPGDSVAIVGGGTIGLLMLQLARLSGATQIILVEPKSERREIAERLSADYVLDPALLDIAQKVRDLSSGGADVVIECAGNAKAAALSLDLAKPGGTVVLFGLAGKQEAVSLNLQDIFLRELTIKSSLLNPFTFKRAVDMLVSNSIRVDVLEPAPVALERMAGFFSEPQRSTKTKYQVFPSN